MSTRSAAGAASGKSSHRSPKVDPEYIRDAQIAEGRRGAPVQYSPPPAAQEWWRIYLAVSILPLNGNTKSVLASLVDRANPTTGRCDPSEATLADDLGVSRRTVERAISDLLKTPFLARHRRYQSSNAYQIGWAALEQAYEIYKTRGRERIENRQNCRITDDASDAETRQPCRISTDRTGGSVPTELADQNKKLKSKENIKHEVPSARAAAPDGAAPTSGDMPPDHQAGNLACQCKICRRDMAEFTDYRRDRERACKGATKEWTGGWHPDPQSGAQDTGEPRQRELRVMSVVKRGRPIHFPQLEVAFAGEPDLLEVIAGLSCQEQEEVSRLHATKGYDKAHEWVSLERDCIRREQAKRLTDLAADLRAVHVA